ncbi:IS5 family transposase [Mesorhizobium sp. B2-1-8]|uniref:IS5 family transposase n=1 Tax=Mesorhizobium sp. B2-1-8 TaxID=2589967 RepID=UPI001D10062B|nr:IS5 family transposase [Mesorhizobium sp. B2-1-8]UCI18503.1 IS5 family transposase [Mesorhizobium sp. B2-1-8]
MSRPREKRETGEQDLFRSRLDQIINMKHELVRLAQAIDWPVLEERFGAVYSDGPGMPPLPTRLMAGLAILKHTFDLSDEELCARWVENPYFQYLCGEEFFRHELSFERSSMTRWRQRMGEEPITALLQESLAVAVKSGAMKPADTRRVIVDTTVQPKKNVMFPTDAKLVNRARERLVRLAKKAGLDLRQTYVRVGKLALIKHQRYAHAKQFKRANKALRKLKTYLGRTIRDISRRITGQTDLEASFKWPLYQASAVLEQRQRQRGRKIYSLHAHEVECIGKGKAHAPYEFGVKVSIATTLERSKGGQFALHAKALPGRGHNAPESHKLRVFTAGQKRRVTPAIKRQMRRRSAVEPVIGHIKAEHRMGRNYLAGEQGDAINAILAAAGYNFSLLIKWFRLLLWLLITALQSRPRSSAA